MKLFLAFLLVITAGIHCFGEAGPENTFLTIQNGKISGQTSIVKTELRGDTLAVEFQAEFTGKGTYDFDIPAGKKWSTIKTIENITHSLLFAEIILINIQYAPIYGLMQSMLLQAKIFIYL